VSAERLEQAESRIMDMLLQDDGQAFKEARKYLERYRPDLIRKIDLAERDEQNIAVIDAAIARSKK